MSERERESVCERVSEGTMPWAIFLFRIFFNYLSPKFEKIKIKVWKSDNLSKRREK